MSSPLIVTTILPAFFHESPWFICKAHTLANMNQMFDPAKRGHSGAQLYLGTATPICPAMAGQMGECGPLWRDKWANAARSTGE
jgi:hypothetical protein